VNYSADELRSVAVTLHSVRLDFDFPVGTRKKIQPFESGIPWPVVDLHDMTCTCDRWLEFGAKAARGEPRRLCRHIRTYLLNELNPADLGHLVGMSEDGWPRSVIDIKEVRVDGAFLCWAGLTDAETPFLSVYARSRRPADTEAPGTGGVRAYRLSKTGDRWGHGEAPYGASKIKKALAASGIWRP
jgi:hypothetical protein